MRFFTTRKSSTPAAGTEHSDTRPAERRSLEQVHHHVKELCEMIKVLESRFEYVPDNTYVLLAGCSSHEDKKDGK